MTQYVASVVGLTHSRGVNKVMLIEGNEAHSKGLAVICKGYCEKVMLSTEVEKKKSFTEMIVSCFLHTLISVCRRTMLQAEQE